MTDEEILKRMAEIEGHLYITLPTGQVFGGVSMDVNVPPNAQPETRLKAVLLDGNEWNPLTNWSDLGPLITPTMTILVREYISEVYYENVVVEHKSLPHAICLAIIESHE